MARAESLAVRPAAAPPALRGAVFGRPLLRGMLTGMGGLRRWMAMAACAAAVSCAGPQQPAAAGAAPRPRAAPPATPALEGPSGLPGAIIADLASRDAEVLFARRGAQGMMVARSGGRWLAGGVRLRLGADGRGLRASVGGRLTEVGAAPARGPASLGRAGTGFALAWSTAHDQGGTLWVRRFDATGEAEGKPQRLLEGPAAIGWAEVLAGPSRGYVAWEAGSAERRDIGLISLAAPAGSASSAIASAVGGWHAVASPNGAAVAWVSVSDGARGRVRLLRVGADGKRRAPVELNDAPTAQADVQLAALRHSYLAAWTDDAGDDPHVYAASIGLDGSVRRRAAPALAPVGRQALVALVANAPGDGALLAFEQQGAGGALRRITLRLLDEQGTEQAARAQLVLPADAGLPRFVADGSGYALLTLAPAVLGDEPVAAATILPTAVRLSPTLEVRASEPIRSAALARRDDSDRGVPAMVHGLDCQSGRCTLLAQSGGEHPAVALLGLPARRSPWHAPLRQQPPQPAKPLALRTIGRAVQPVDELAAARLADGRTLVAWLTHGEAGAASGHGGIANGATLAYRLISADGELGGVQVLSHKAIAHGGVAVAASPAERARRRGHAPVAVIAWAALLGGSPQVFVSSIDAAGKRLQQRTVTRIQRRRGGRVASEVFDVSIAAEPEGSYLCAWSDTRHTDPEIYLARVGPTLDKAKPDRRITNAAGASTESALTVRGGRALLAWSDARDGTPAADVFVTAVDRRTLDPVGKPRRLERSRAHSRTPRFGAGDAMLVWIEEGDSPGGTGASASPASARLVALDPAGQPQTAVRRLTLAGGANVISAAVGCTEARCRTVLLGARGTALVVGAADTKRLSGAPLRASALVTLAGGSLQDPSMVAADAGLGALYFAQQDGAGSRLRNLRLSW